MHRVLFPGGGIWNTFYRSDGYAEAGTHIFQIAKELNDNGVYFPLFGTCLGFQLLLYTSNENKSCRRICSSVNQSLPLHFSKGLHQNCSYFSSFNENYLSFQNYSPDYKNSRMYGLAPESVINILKNDPVTPNFHIYCLTQKVN